MMESMQPEEKPTGAERKEKRMAENEYSTIMAIGEKCGMKSEEQGVVLSMLVEEIAGLD